MSEHDERADELEREADDMQERVERLEDETDEAGEDWERKKRDPSVPGAVDDDDGE
jgi:predicted  nucleic acid-binding Zn-ribbon protein